MSIEHWEHRYGQIHSYEIQPDNQEELERAKAWVAGAKIDADGKIVEIQPKPPKTTNGVSEERKSEVAHQLQLKPIAPEETEIAPKMPDTGSLFFGAFRNLYDAYWETCEVCEPYLLAGALTQVGAMLGRRSCISIGRKPSTRHIIYPNFYNVIIGATSIARKSTWLRQVRYDLRHVDYEIKTMESLASAEGMIDALAKDSSGDIIETYGQECPEGQRTLILFDEIKTLFGNARRQITSTIIPRLTEAYNCPEFLEVNTKYQPIKALHPVVSVLAASTGEWLSDSVTQSDVSGGFINRFCYFLYEYTQPKAEPEDPHSEPLAKWYSDLEKLRAHGDQMRQFVLSDDAWEIYNEEYDQHHRHQWENRENFETAASAREMVNSFKVALAFAAMTNEPDDNKVSPAAWLHARAVATYVSKVNAFLFKSIGAGEESKDEQIVLDKLAKMGNEVRKNELRQKIGGKNMSLDAFNKVLETLQRSGIIMVSESRPVTVVRIEK